MSRLSDALGVPEGKPFEFRDHMYVINGNARYYASLDGILEGVHCESSITSMLDNPSEIKLLPTRYKRKEPEIVEAYKIGTLNAPAWVTKIRPGSDLTYRFSANEGNRVVESIKWRDDDKFIRSVSIGDYVVLDSDNCLHKYTAKEFESTFEEVEP